MFAQRQFSLTHVLLIVLIVLVAADLAMRFVAPENENRAGAFAVAHAQNAPAGAEASQATDGGESARRVPFFYPQFPIETGRKRLFHIGIMVKDLEESVDFYVNKMGFKHIRTQDMGFVRIAFISTGDGEPLIELEELTREIPGMKSEGFSHIGLFVDDVDAFYEKSIAEGVAWQGKPGRPGPGAPYMGFAIDPDGYRLEVMENPQADCTSCHRGPHLN